MDERNLVAARYPLARPYRTGIASRWQAAWTAGLLLSVQATGSAMAQDMGPPVACELGRTCFVQQFADMQPGPEVADPFCAHATYDGHDGTDFRVLSMADVARGVDVLAMAGGRVLRGRDGVPDRLVRSESDRRAVADRECGNGLIVQQANGLEAQYCHLRQGSIAVKAGEMVKRGQTLGRVGASGLAAFPHVHVTLRRNGQVVEPVTGRPLDAGCSAAGPGTSLFAPDVAAAIGRTKPQVLGLGVTDHAVEESELDTNGSPSPATTASPAIVGWAWLINLEKGDALRVRLFSPDGSVFSELEVPPLDRSKASYVAFAGRKRQPAAGDYTVEATVVRGGEPLSSASATVAVR